MPFIKVADIVSREQLRRVVSDSEVVEDDQVLSSPEICEDNQALTFAKDFQDRAQSIESNCTSYQADLSYLADGFRALKTETSQHVLIADHMFSKLSNKDLKLAKAGAVQQLEVLEKESSTHFEALLSELKTHHWPLTSNHAEEAHAIKSVRNACAKGRTRVAARACAVRMTAAVMAQEQRTYESKEDIDVHTKLASSLKCFRATLARCSAAQDTWDWESQAAFWASVVEIALGLLLPSHDSILSAPEMLQTILTTACECADALSLPPTSSLCQHWLPASVFFSSIMELAQSRWQSLAVVLTSQPVWQPHASTTISRASLAAHLIVALWQQLEPFFGFVNGEGAYQMLVADQIAWISTVCDTTLASHDDDSKLVWACQCAHDAELLAVTTTGLSQAHAAAQLLLKRWMRVLYRLVGRNVHQLLADYNVHLGLQAGDVILTASKQLQVALRQLNSRLEEVAPMMSSSLRRELASLALDHLVQQLLAGIDACSEVSAAALLRLKVDMDRLRVAAQEHQAVLPSLEMLLEIVKLWDLPPKQCFKLHTLCSKEELREDAALELQSLDFDKNSSL